MITGEVVEIVEESTTKNIIIYVCFTDSLGGELVWNFKSANQSIAPIVRKGKNVWPLYAGYHNFIGKSPEEQAKWIQLNIESQIGNIIKERTKTAVNSLVIEELNKNMVGTTYLKNNVDMSIGINDTPEKRTVTINYDGTWNPKKNVVKEIIAAEEVVQ